MKALRIAAITIGVGGMVWFAGDVAQRMGMETAILFLLAALVYGAGTFLLGKEKE